MVSETSRLRPEAPGETGGERPRRLRDAELDELRKALAYTRGHQGRAAALLGISRKSLWEKRRRFGIE
jgi:transcriptional regulator of acetoin/glycerol metabolism